MFTISIIVSLTLVALIVGQAILVVRFIARLRRPPTTPQFANQWPKVALIVCIRGKDPTLLECLNAALNQDYPEYGVHIIIDSQSDPAWPLVRELISANPLTPTTVETLANPLSTCSLKCSSLIQAISGLDSDYKIVALLDTDVVPHRRWLKDMIAPLSDRKVGASTGNRWIAPVVTSYAGLVRYAWNAAAVMFMYSLKIAWGGSLAIKRTVIEEGGLLLLWRHSYGDDTTINSALRLVGRRLEFVPNAMMIERGECSISKFLDWATRQLLSCRLHHKGWAAVLGHGLVIGCSLGFAACLFLAGIRVGNDEVIILTGAALAGYFVALFGLLLAVESNLRRVSITGYRSEERKRSLASCGKLMLALVLANVLHLYVILRAATARTVQWRRVNYRILKKNRIKLLEKDAAANHAPSALLRGLGVSLRRHL